MRTYHLQRVMRIQRPIDQVFAFFADPRNLEAITPPWLHFEILGASTPKVHQGTEIDYRLRLHGVPLRWRSRISLWEPPLRFVDEQIRGPYRLWRHLHSFEPEGATTVARDWVEYAVWGGAPVRRCLVEPDIERIFDFRAQALGSADYRVQPALDATAWGA